MRAILIDPASRAVTEIKVTGSLDNFYKVMDCSMITVVYPTEQRSLFDGHVIYADDEGLFKDNLEFTRITPQSPPVAGRMVIIGDDGEGGSMDCTLDVDDVQEKVQWGVGQMASAY